MERYTYKDEEYIINNGLILDEQYCEVYDSLRAEIAENYIKDQGNIPFESLIEAIDFLRKNNSFVMSIQLMNIYLEDEKININKAKHILPMLTADYRALHSPKEAIKYFELYVKRFGNYVISVPLLTSVAAAYLDINDLKQARYYCNRAYAMNKNSLNNTTPELHSVYTRLNKLEEN